MLSVKNDSYYGPVRPGLVLVHHEPDRDGIARWSLYVNGKIVHEGTRRITG